jgi:hypothetical protein
MAVFLEKASATMYNAHTNGTRSAHLVEVASAINPMINGTIAPPTMAVTIRPDNSLILSGIFSTVMLKIKGKILANPNPIRKMLTIASV